MVLSNNNLKANLFELSNKDTKISREVKNEKIFKIKNGLYDTVSTTPGYLLAGIIYGPSYLSFDYALSYYGLIPERVANYTSATFNKKKKKKYSNIYGTFFYRDVPEDVYPIGVIVVQEGDYSFQIATKEKALCDKLYTLKPLANLNELRDTLFSDLRIDEDEFKSLDIDAIMKISSYYHCTNVSLLAKFMRGDISE